MKTKVLLASIMLAMIICGDVSAKNDNSTVKAQFGGTQISFASIGTSSNSTLSISGPDGYNVSKATKVGTPSLDLHQHGDLKDGLYQYEITTNTGPLVLVKDKINNGRGDDNSHYARKGVTKSGHFWVVNGQIKKFQHVKEPAFR